MWGCWEDWEKSRKQYKYETSSRFSEQPGGKDTERVCWRRWALRQTHKTLAELSKTSIILRRKGSKEGAILTVLCEITDLLWLIFFLPSFPPYDRVDSTLTLHGGQDGVCECVGE